MSTQVQLLPPGPFLFAFADLWRGSSVGQYERLITSKRRCKSCPRNQTFLGLLPCSPSPVTVENCLRRSSNAALSRQYEAQQFAACRSGDRRAGRVKYSDTGASLPAPTASEHTRGDSKMPPHRQRRLEPPWA